MCRDCLFGCSACSWVFAGGCTCLVALGVYSNSPSVCTCFPALAFLRPRVAAGFADFAIVFVLVSTGASSSSSLDAATLSSPYPPLLFRASCVAPCAEFLLPFGRPRFDAFFGGLSGACAWATAELRFVGASGLVSTDLDRGLPLGLLVGRSFSRCPASASSAPSEPARAERLAVAFRFGISGNTYIIFFNQTMINMEWLYRTRHRYTFRPNLPQTKTSRPPSNSPPSTSLTALQQTTCRSQACDVPAAKPRSDPA